MSSKSSLPYKPSTRLVGRRHAHRSLGPACYLFLAALLASPTGAQADDLDPGDFRLAVGVDLGGALPGGGGEGFYSFGLGKAYVISGQAGHWRLDWRLSESYDLFQKEDLGATVDGQFSGQSMSLARVFSGSMHPTLGVGATMVSSSLAVIGDDGIVRDRARNGIGANLFAEISYEIEDTLAFVLGARAYLVKWEEVPGSVVYEADSTGFQEGLEPDAGIPFSLNLGVRLFWD